MRTRWHILSIAVPIGGAALLAVPAAAQVPAAVPTQIAQTPEIPAYKPPLRGAPGGRVGGASRGGIRSLPTVELLSPSGHSGLTTSPTPTLFYFVSQPVSPPIKLTINVADQPQPIVETNLPVPPGAGIQAIRLGDYRVQLQPGVAYKWSVSIVVDPRVPSNNVVATATMMLAAPDGALDGAVRSAPPARRAALYAQAGFWYDALASAVEVQNTDRHAALDALLDQVGLTAVAAYDRSIAR